MVIDSTDINRLNLAQQELHQMMESDVRYGVSFLISWFLNVSFFFFSNYKMQVCSFLQINRM